MASPERKRCLGCGYILDGLPEPRCPECGRGFDPKDDTTYFVGLRSGRSFLVCAIVAATVIAAVFVSSLFERLSRTGDVVNMPSSKQVLWDLCAVIPAWLGSAAVEAYVLYVSVRALRRSAHTLRAHREWIAAAVISGLSVGLFIAGFVL